MKHLFVALALLIASLTMAAQAPSPAAAKPSAAPAPSAEAVARAQAAVGAKAGIRTDADPVLWRVKGPHGTVYLFGTVHVMRPEVHWKTARIRQALAASDSVYFEIADLDNAAAAQPLVMKLGLDQAHPLSTKISKGDVAILDAAAKGLGAPNGEASFEPMQPWLVSMSLSILPAIRAGYDPGSGIDKALMEDAKAQKKPIKGFETMEEQIHMLADTPQEKQVVMLHQTLAELSDSAAKLDKVVAGWTRGDTTTIAKYESDELALKYPELYQQILVQRNGRWATKLTSLLNDEHGGTTFVAVGAAHLVGPDSVLHALEAAGFHPERI